MPNRNKRARDKNRFIFTDDLNLIKPYIDYNMCIGSFISRFDHNDYILYNKNIGFALIKYRDFCPINILNDPYCLDYIPIHENQRGKGHGKRLMKFILKYFQIVLHTTDNEQPFFEHISKDLGLEKINRKQPFGASYISTNLDTNRDPIVNMCLGSCGEKYSGYKRYVCNDCYIEFARYNIDMDLIELNDDLRSKLNVTKPSIIFSSTGESFIEMLENNDIDCIKPVFEEILNQLNMFLIS